MTLGCEGLNAGLGHGNHLFLQRIGNGNIHGLSHHLRHSQLGILPFGEFHVAYDRFLAGAIIALPQYVSRSQKSLECFLVQNWEARRLGALHVYK